MKKIVYFKICNSEAEYNNIRHHKEKRYKWLDTIIKNIYKLNFKIMTNYNIISMLKYNDKKMYIIYSKKENKSNLLCKINHKIEKLLQNNANIKIIISKEIKELIKSSKNIKNVKKLTEILQESMENKTMYKDFINEVMLSVIKLRKEIPEEQSIYILLNSNSVKYINWINKIILNYKMINIVTQHVNQFKAFEDNAEDNLEPVSVLNNKRKSIAKAKYIINVDFSYEEIINYCINRNAFIFNISDAKIKYISNFDGIIINNINIENREEFDFKDEYIKGKMNTNEILKNIESYRYEIEGNNGKIEFEQIV